jgi:hypothetical protein
MHIGRQALLLAFLPLVALAGCGSDGPARAVVVGKVTYQGQPVADGEIRFTPIKGTTGPLSVVKIVDGQFRADRLGGVPVATQRVEILAYRADPRYKGQEKNKPPMYSAAEWPPKVQYLPEKYNTKTELEAVVEAGRGEVRHDFELAK